MVEAAGIEPASGEQSSSALRECPAFYLRLAPSRGRDGIEASSFSNPGAYEPGRQGLLAFLTPESSPASEAGWTTLP